MAKRKNVYEANDGTAFDTLKEAIKHDRELEAVLYFEKVICDKLGIEPHEAADLTADVIQINNDINNILKGKNPTT